MTPSISDAAAILRSPTGNCGLTTPRITLHGVTARGPSTGSNSIGSYVFLARYSFTSLILQQCVHVVGIRYI